MTLDGSARVWLLLALTVLVPGAGLVALAAGSIQAEERLLVAQREARGRDVARVVREGLETRARARLSAVARRLKELSGRGDDPREVLTLEPAALVLDPELRLIVPSPAWSAGGSDLPAPGPALDAALAHEAAGRASEALAAAHTLPASAQQEPAAVALRARTLARLGRKDEALVAERALVAKADAPAATRWHAQERLRLLLVELGHPDAARQAAQEAAEALVREAGRGATPGTTWDALGRACAAARELAGAAAVPSAAAPLLALARAAADLEALGGPVGLAALEPLPEGARRAPLLAGPEAGGAGWLLIAAPQPDGLRAGLLLAGPELAGLVEELTGADRGDLLAELAPPGPGVEPLGAGLHLRVRERQTALGEDLRRRRGLQRGALLAGLVLTIATGALLGARALRRQAELARLRADFVASVTHELRTPVASIRAMAEVLGVGKLEPERQAEYFRAIAQEARRLGRRIEDVLDAARLERGAFHPRPEPVDLLAAAGAAVEALRSAAGSAGLRLVLRPPAAELPLARADPALLERALENLLENALKHGRPPEEDPDPARREIELSLGVDPDGPWVRVTDRGPGIPAAEQPRVFERYFRGQGARERPGAGLGLSIVDSIARAQGGRVALVSEPGQGASFTLHLRAWREEAAS